MDLFFNELSVKEEIHKEAGKGQMAGLLVVYKRAMSLGLKEFKTTAAFLTFPLAPGYLIRDWLNDHTVDREARAIVRSKVSKSPYIDELVAQKDKNNNLLHEFNYGGHQAIGLGAAYLFNAIAASFANADEWANHSLKLHVTEYNEEDKIVTTPEEVKHASTATHFDFFSIWLKQEKDKQIANGKLLWLKRNDYFPHLVFCKDVQDQIEGLSGNEPEFHMIKNRLYELEQVCSEWKTGIIPIDHFPSRVSPESETRLAQFRNVLNKVCPDGKEREFSLHSRYTPGPGRIHFFPEPSEKRIYIGYIGPKIQ